MKRIKKFGVSQTAKVVATIYAVIALILIIPMMFISSVTSAMPFGGVYTMLFIPALYWVFTFAITAIGCFVYNIVAEKTGGIEIDIELSHEH